MNRIIYLVLMVGFLLLITNKTLITQDLDCPEYDDECLNPSLWQSSYKDIELDDFPGCTIRVYFNYRQCDYTSGNHTTQWVLDYMMLNLPDCWNVYNYITNNGTGITSDKIRDFKILVVRKVSLDIFTDWYNNAPQWAKNAVECGQGSHHKSMYYTKSCTKQCFATYHENGETYHTLTEVACHDHEYTECCGITYHYCMDNGEPQITTTTTGHESNCYFAPYPDPSGCPEDAADLEVLWCRDNCLED